MKKVLTALFVFLFVAGIPLMSIGIASIVSNFNIDGIAFAGGQAVFIIAGFVISMFIYTSND